MKYIITESKLNNTIIEYLNNMFDVDDINSVNPYQYDDDTGEEWEDNTIVDFYKGDYDGPYDSDFCFRWYDPEHYSGGDYVGLQKKCPIIEINDTEGEILNSYFGDRWHIPFKIWFEENFRLPVKTVEVGISS
jgi:hypothetical protein